MRVEVDHPGAVLERASPVWSVDLFRGRTRWVRRYEFAPACAAPCATTLPSDGVYRVAWAIGESEGAPPSSPFALPQRESLRLRVDPGDRRLHDLGGVLSVLGGLTLLGGGGALWATAGDGHPAWAVGGSLLAVGAVALAVGIPLLVGNATTVHFD